MNRHTNSLLAIVLLLAVSASAAEALNSISEGYRLNSSAQTISGYSTCYQARTTSGSDVFFPTKTATEWSAFAANKPSTVTLGSCCAGTSYGGYCWYVGGYGQSCDAACSTHGGVNMSGTLGYAGSGGNLTQCVNVASALGYAPSPGCAYDVGNQTWGCITYIAPSGCRIVNRGSYPNTTSESVISGSGNPGRICACNN